MNSKLYFSKRSGALGALMDLYEQEADLLLETLNNKVQDSDWSVIMDAKTKDEDCRSIQTICQHLVGAAKYYIELLKKGENPAYKMEQIPVALPNKKDFEPQFSAVLETQAQYFENRWDMGDDDIEAIKIKTGWGSILDMEGVLEHAVIHVMRHHRQILRWLS